MIRLILGIVLEIIAFLIFLVFEYFSLPLTFSLFVHLCAVYLVTRSLEGKLIEMELPRELCFFFTFFFPLSGIAGVLFYIFILKNIEHKISLKSQIKVEPHLTSIKPYTSFFYEEDNFYNFKSSFCFRLPYSLFFNEILDSGLDLPFNLRLQEKDLEKIKIQTFANLSAESKDSKNKAEENFSDLKIKQLILLASLWQIEDDKYNRYLEEAEKLVMQNTNLNPKIKQTYLIEILFLKKDYQACLEEIKIKKATELDANSILRVGECLYHLKEYQKLKELASKVTQNSNFPDKIKNLFLIWC